MANWYVDIDNESPNGSGTQSNPFNFGNLLNFLNRIVGTEGPTGDDVTVSDNDNIYIKGRYFSSSDIQLFPVLASECNVNNVKLLPWNFETNGHWVLNAPNIYLFPHDDGISSQIKFYLNGCILRGYIFTTNNSGISGGNVSFDITNSIIYKRFNFVNKNINLDKDKLWGCTFANSDFILTEVDDATEVMVNDCVFHDCNITIPTGGSVNDSILFKNCVISSQTVIEYSSGEDTVSFDSCETDWNPLRDFPFLLDVSKDSILFELFGLPIMFALDGDSVDTSRKVYYENNGLTQGAYGSNRRSAGSYYFANNEFYVDATKDGNGEGSETDPLCLDQIGRDFSYDGDVYKLKGVIDNKPMVFSDNVTLTSWDNGIPYKIRIYDQAFTGADLTVKNGMVYYSNGNSTSFTDFEYVYDSVLAAPYGGIANLSLSPVSVRGSTFVFGSGARLYVGASGKVLDFKDCMLQTYYLCGGNEGSEDPENPPSIKYDTCVTLLSASDYIGGHLAEVENITTNNMQYDWDGIHYLDGSWETWEGFLSTSDIENFTFSNVTSGDGEITLSASGEEYNNYEYGLWSTRRYSVGAYYFDSPDAVIDTSELGINAQVFQSDIIGTGYVEIQNHYLMRLQINDPKVYEFKDLEIDFKAEPVRGSSPLLVKYTAYVTKGGNVKGNIRVREYRWYFDVDNYPDEYVSSNEPVIYKTHTGVKGRTYSVRLCVILEPK